MATYKKFMVVADNHGELICKKAAAKVAEFQADFKPHYRVHLGDVWDACPLRKSASKEEMAQGIAEDYAAGWEFLDAYKPTHLTLGNHDDRIWMHTESHPDGLIRERCQELAMDAEDKFRKMRIQFVHYCIDNYLRLPEGGPKLIHGYRSSMYPAKAHHDNWGSCIHGHVHHPDDYTARHVDGGRSMSVGCIGDIKRMTYADRTPSRLGWRNSFIYGYINTRTGAWDAWSVVKERNGHEWVSPLGIL